MTEEEKLEEISEKLDSILGVLSAQFIFGKSQDESIAGLSSAGLQPKDIAKIVGMSREEVNKKLYAIRHRKGTKRAKKD